MSVQLQLCVYTECLPPLHLRTETDLVSETYFLEYQTMNKVQNLSNKSVVYHRHNHLEPTLMVVDGRIMRITVTFLIFFFNSLSEGWSPTGSTRHGGH
jgi:hypothetical protein